MPLKDNAGLQEKLELRRKALRELGATPPVVLEMYAGAGAIGSRIYLGCPPGIAIERDEAKSAQLVAQRAAWRVYEGECVELVAAGIGSDLDVNFVDVDPYGDPWPAIQAVLSSRRLHQGGVLAVNDGLRRGIKLGVAWRYKSLGDAVRQFGADLHDRYLEICRWLLDRKAGEAGLKVTRFAGFYGGHAKQMTHYYAVIERGAG